MFQVEQQGEDLDRLLDAGWGKVKESSQETKATIARLKKAYSEAPLWAYDERAGRETRGARLPGIAR